MSVASEMRRGWPLVLTSGIGFGLGLSSMLFMQAAFAGPLTREFGWSQGQVHLGMTVSHFTTVLLIPLIGWLTDRVGVRPIALFSVTAFGLAFSLLSQLNGDFHLYLSVWFLMALGGTGTLTLTWSRAISSAFDEARGLALGLALVGSGVAGFLGPPFAQHLITDYGWRHAFMMLACLPLFVSLPMVFFFFREGPNAIPPARVKGEPFAGGALTNWRLWVLTLAFLLIAGGVSSLVPNMPKIVTRHGISQDEAIKISALVGLFTIFGRFFFGWLIDRCWAPLVGLGVLGIAAISCFLLSDPNLTVTQAQVAAVLLGLTLGGEFDLMPYLASRYFGVKRLGAVLGVVAAGFYIGAGSGAPVMGHLYDTHGDFDLGLLIAGSLFLVAAAMLLALGRYPKQFTVGQEKAADLPVQTADA